MPANFNDLRMSTEKAGGTIRTEGSHQLVNGLNYLDTLNQRTLKSAVACDGIGLHTGDAVAMTLRPADAGAGIAFTRTDIIGSEPIRAHWDRVVDTIQRKLAVIEAVEERIALMCL